MQMFNCLPVQECVAKRRHKFLVNYIASYNIMLNMSQQCCMLTEYVTPAMTMF